MPKGDADNLRADIDDGYAKISNLLLEMLSCAPLTATEYRVVFFIMRRTYGWAKNKKRNTGKIDVMRAEDIARGIGRPVSTVEKALHALVGNRVLYQVPLLPDRFGTPCGYGMNPDTEEWGNGRDWTDARLVQREAKENDAYSRNRQLAIAEIGKPEAAPIAEMRKRKLREKAIVDCGNRQLKQATSLTATGPADAPTDSITTSITDKNDLAPAARGSHDPSKDTSQQAAIRKAWEATGGEGAPGGKGYPGLVALVQTKGLPLVEEWVAHLQDAPVCLPDGADRWRWFADTFRGALSRPWEWRGKSGAQTAGRVKLRRVRPDGTFQYEDTFEPDQRAEIIRYDAAHDWDNERGMAYSDPRHPDFGKGAAQ